MMLNIPTINALAKVQKFANGTPFYAGDCGLNGGQIVGLRSINVICATGNVKKYMVNLYDDIYKEVEVKEWIVRSDLWDYTKRVVNETRKYILETAELLKDFEL